ncbi:MAG TPA: PAS domain S-box protein [Hyphomicrobium sp.]|nr:PAS domain S-box protein [Hyphomicrobium sp.]
MKRADVLSAFDSTTRERIGSRALALAGTCRSWPLAWRLGVAALIVLAALVLRLTLLGGLEERLVYLAFYPAVMMAAIVGGFSAGVLATVLSAILAHWLLLAPLRETADWLALVTFLVTGGLIVAITEAFHTTQASLAAAERDRENEQRQRLFIEQAPVAMALFDTGMRYLAFSKRWADDYGLDASNILGRSHYDLFPCAPTRWREMHNRGLKGETVSAQEDEFQRSDGTAQWLRWEVRPWRQGDGAIGGIIIFSEDITSSKLTQRRLQESEERLSAIVNTAAESIIVIDVHGVIQSVNPATEAIFSYGPEDLLGRNANILLAEPHPIRHDEPDRSCPGADAGKVIGLGRDVEGRRKDGSLFPVDLAVTEWRDGQGRRFFTAIIRDVTARRQAEDALRKFSRVVEQTASTVVITDADGVIQYVNPRFTELSGYSADEAIGRRPSLLKSGHTSSEDYAKLWQTIKGGGVWHGEFRNLRKDGSLYWETAIISPVRDTSGLVTHFVAIKDDISERKHADERLRESEARFRAMFESAAVGIAQSGPDGIWLRVNNRLCETLGYTAAELMTKSFLDVTHPDDIAADVALLRRMLAREIDTYSIEKRYVHKDGPIVWANVTVGCARQADGTVDYLIKVIEDISARKLAEAELERIRTILAEGQRIAHLGSWEYIAQTRETIWSDEQKRIYGLDPGEPSPAYEEMLRHHIRPEDARELDRSFRSALQNAAVFENENRIVRPDGSVRWIYNRAIPHFDADGKVVKYVGATLDITERKQAEEELAQTRRLEAVGHLAGGVAHDFNNLLAIIAGNLELAARRVHDEVAQQLLNRALEATQIGGSFNRRLLSLVRKRNLEPVRLSLNARVQEAIKLMTRTLGEHVRLKAELAPDLWNIVADAGEVDSALLNLASNARDAMPNGGNIIISTSNISLDTQQAKDLHADARPGDYARMAVADDGVGMSEETLRRAMEPFFTTKGPGKGTGLGLSSVASFTRQARGFATILSKPGDGCLVNIYLPRAQDPTEKRLSAPIPRRNLPMGDGELVLVVEDDDQVREVTLGRVESLGYAVVAARSGPEAVQCLQAADPIRLVLTDIVMPGGMTGYDVARWVRVNASGIGVILTSGYNEGDRGAGDGNALLEEKILVKPYSREQLASALHDALGTSSTWTASRE